MFNFKIEYGNELNNCLTIVDLESDDHVLIYVNHLFQKSTGYSKEESIGRNCRFLQGPETNPEHVANIKKAIIDRNPIFQDILNYTKDGLPFLNRLLIVPEGGDDVRYYIGIQHLLFTGDEAIKESKVEKNIDVKEATHGLNNILNRIISTLLVLESPLIGEEQEKKFREFSQNAIKDLSDFVLTF